MATTSIITHGHPLSLHNAPPICSVVLRAVFPNPNGTLLPGMYVKARLVEGIEEHAILVPQKGVSREERGNATALVVGPGNKVQKRVTDTVRTVGDRWLVSRGIRPGYKPVDAGLMRDSTGAVVNQ